MIPDSVKTDRFTQLVDDISSGRLSLTQVQIAVKEGVRGWKQLPEGTKQLLCGKSDSCPGLISRAFQNIQEIIGTVELAYRRGEQAGKESAEEERALTSDEEHTNNVNDHTGQWGGAGPDCSNGQG